MIAGDIVVSMKNTTKAKAKRIVAQINQNLDDLYADKIDHNSFTRNQIAIWSQAGTGPVKDAVMALLRGEDDR